MSLAALRGVDPCGLLADGALAEFGKTSQPQRQGWSRCRGEATDAGGKTVSVTLKVGRNLSVSPTDATGGVSGLPLIVRTQDSSTCFATAVMSKEPAIGSTVQVEYEGGQPCRAGKMILRGVVETLRGEPPKLPKHPGSLLRVDPCAVLSGDTVSDVVGTSAEPLPTDIHGCRWKGGEPALRVDFRLGPVPDPSGQNRVDLGGNVTGYTEQTMESISACSVEWVHRKTADDRGELVRVSYDNYAAKPEKDKPCKKVVQAAKTVISTLAESG